MLCGVIGMFALMVESAIKSKYLIQREIVTTSIDFVYFTIIEISGILISFSVLVALSVYDFKFIFSREKKHSSQNTSSHSAKKNPTLHEDEIENINNSFELEGKNVEKIIFDLQKSSEQKSSEQNVSIA